MAGRPPATDGKYLATSVQFLLDRTLIINQRHAAAVLTEYAHHYNAHRPHRTLGHAAPLRPLPQRTTSAASTVRRRDRLGGLIHEYQQVAWGKQSFRHAQDRGPANRTPAAPFPSSMLVDWVRTWSLA